MYKKTANLIYKYAVITRFLENDKYSIDLTTAKVLQKTFHAIV
jgi:hypothetical protein